MPHNHNLPLALQRAQMTYWMRIGELLHDSRRRWLELAHHALVRDTHVARADTVETKQSPDWTALASLPMHAGWRMLNHGVSNTRDLTLTAINNHTAFDAGMRRALAQWQIETGQALSVTRNVMPFSGASKSLIEPAAPAPAESAAPAPAESSTKQERQ